MLANYGILDQSKGYELCFFFLKLVKGYAFEYSKKKIYKWLCIHQKNSFIVSDAFVDFQIQGNLYICIQIMYRKFQMLVVQRHI